MRRSSGGGSWLYLTTLVFMGCLTYANYRMVVWVTDNDGGGRGSSTSDSNDDSSALGEDAQRAAPQRGAVDVSPPPSRRRAIRRGSVIGVGKSGGGQTSGSEDAPADGLKANGAATESPITTTTFPPDVTDPPDAQINPSDFQEALKKFDEHLKVKLPGGKVTQGTKEFVDVKELPDHGILLPHDPHRPPPMDGDWKACDPRNATFSDERDARCHRYLSDWNHMRSMKPLSAILLNGRTLKFKVFYHHGNLTAIIKVSQSKFFFEPVSEILAFHVDRALHFGRIPPTVYIPVPLDYFHAASVLLGPFYSQWFNNFVTTYDITSELFVDVNDQRCANVTIQLWMYDVHSALRTYLAVNYDADDYFFEKFFIPSDVRQAMWPPRPHRLTAIGDLGDRFIFDYLIGNTDRGLNDHNNFVYGGCQDHKTECSVPKEEWKRTYGPAKYAFLDHGSSLHSHKEPEDNPLSNNFTHVQMCRYRRSTIRELQRYQRSGVDKERGVRPFYDAVRPILPRGVFNVVRKSVFKTIQERIDKVLETVHWCIEKYGEQKVYSL